jgi:hypothetical protein
MNTERLLLCRPMGGLNDMLCQIEKACRYAERFDRTVVVDANYYLSRYFRDDLSTYFTSRQSTLILDPAELGERLDEMEVFPGVLAGRVNRYETRYDLDLYQYVDADSGHPLSFDFERDYAERLIVHHDDGGGEMSLGALARLRLRPELRAALSGRLRRIGPRYSGVHVRNTDYRVRYEGLLSAGKIDPTDPIFVATDNVEVVARFRDAFGAERVHSFASLPDLAGYPLHHIRDPQEAYERNRDAILDLLMLALATSLHMFQLEPNPYDIKHSGFSLLAANLRGAPAILAGLIEESPDPSAS